MQNTPHTYTISYGKQQLPYTDTAGSVIFCARAGTTASAPPRDLVEEALSHPVGSLPLEQLVHDGDTVAILVDDVTRPTPRKLLLQALTDRLRSLRNLRIRIVLALGTHRCMTPDEISSDLGEFAERYPIINVDYRDESRFARAATMPDGTPVRVYKEVLAADVRIGLGNIVPHIAAGWGGGAKIIMPGICCKQTTDAIHMISCIEQNVLATCGNPDNRFRQVMEDLAGRVGLSFIANTVLDERGDLLGVFCGHYIDAHRQGVACADTVLRPQIPQRADILIVSANPANADFWQGAKPYVFAHFAVKPGGVMIFLLSAEEGLCGGAPAHEHTLRHYYNHSGQAVLHALESGEVADVLGIGETFIRLQTEGFCHTILVSDGLSAVDAALLGFERAPSLAAALQKAHAITGPGATVGVIPKGGDLLCRPPVDSLVKG